ncbi:MAG: N-acetylmuramoyl-L-alanine amidase [Candidatus Geothermincolia bacterium]
MIHISEDFFGDRGEELTRSSLRAARNAKRRSTRNAILVIACFLVLAAVLAGVVALLTMRSGGPRVPRLIGMKFSDAKNKVESMGLFIEIDSMQDSTGDCSKLKVQTQDPKEGAGVETNDTVTVRLTGLHESPELTGNTDKMPTGDSPDKPAATAPGEQPDARQPAGNGRSVCLDPGHSPRSGSEVDQATGLNVGDNEGASGEVQAMWDLAQKTKAKLEQAGYTVKLTKDSSDAYASLRARADVGNTCSIMVRLHYDDSGYSGVMRPPQNAARSPQSDPGRMTVVDSNVASASDSLASALATALGLQVRDDTGGTSNGNTTPSGHPTCLIGSVLSTVPVVCIENTMSRVRDNPGGQDEVAAAIVSGINSYFQTR